MAQNLRRDSQFVYLARKVSPDEAQRVKALELKGVAFIKESRRYYPKKELAAHVLGYVGPRQHRTGRSRVDLRCAGPRHRRQDPRPDRREASCAEQPGRSAGDGRRLARTDHRSVPPAHRRARAAGRGGGEQRGGRHRADHGAQHRRDPGAGQLADLQPERVRQGRRARAPQPRHSGSVRARIDLQGRDRVGGARRARGEPDRSDRLRARLHHVPGTQADLRLPSLRGPVVLRRHRQVEQHRGNQGRAAARPGTARTLRQPVRVWPADRPGLQRRELRDRLESREARFQRAGLGLDGISGRR